MLQCLSQAGRVPLLKAIELDPHNPKIAANVALLLSASGAALSPGPLPRGGA